MARQKLSHLEGIKQICWSSVCQAASWSRAWGLRVAGVPLSGALCFHHRSSRDGSGRCLSRGPGEGLQGPACFLMGPNKMLSAPVRTVQALEFTSVSQARAQAFSGQGQSFPAVPCGPSLESCLAVCGSASSLTPVSPVVEKLQSYW